MQSEEFSQPTTEQSTHAPVTVGMIWAQTTTGVIGADGGMPWHLPEDLKHFKSITSGHPVVMGRRTWESFPEKFRPLPGRLNIVISSSLNASDVEMDDTESKTSGRLVEDLPTAFKVARNQATDAQVWILGGGSIYAQAMDEATVVERTVINSDVAGDTSAPELDDTWHRVRLEPGAGWLSSADGVQYRFERWER